MKTSTSRTRLVVLPVSALCLFLLALIWVSYWRQRSFDEKDSIQFAVSKNSNLAIALEQYVIRTLHSADAVLQVVKMEYAEQGESLDLNKLLDRISMNRENSEQVSIIGRDGRLKMTSIAGVRNRPVDFSGSAFFIFHSQNSKDSLLISKPVLSDVTGRKEIIISRRLYDDNGGFAGVVALEIDPSTFTSIYAQTTALPNDIISLIAPDGTTYARRTGPLESSGEDIHKSPLFVHLVNHADSFYFAADALRHIPTWFSYRKLKDYAIIVTVGSSEWDIRADFTKRQLRYIIPRVIISLLIIAFSFLAAWLLVHRRKLSEQLKKEEEKYQRLLTEQMIAVQEREREWIGRELHDNVNQVLTTVKLYLEMASKEDRSPLIPRSMQLINSTIIEIRNLSHQLSAPTLGTRSLVDSINALIETLAFSTKLEFEFNHEGYASVIMSQKLAIYRILQEQLNNIVKHADATKVWIRLVTKDDNLILTVRDNGKGFNETAKSNGMGINNMVSRAKVFEGSVNIKTVDKRGCLLTVTIPTTAEEDAAIHSFGLPVLKGGLGEN
jgi:signal transduction histidine kinase